MHVLIKYLVENDDAELLKATGRFFNMIEMKSKLSEKSVYADKEWISFYEQQVDIGNRYLKKAYKDCKALSVFLREDFILSGVIDTSSDTGKCLYFRFEVKGNNIISRASDWYSVTSIGSYDGYEDFCENFFECSREEYDSVKDSEYVYVLETEQGNVLSGGIPLHVIDVSMFA